MGSLADAAAAPSNVRYNPAQAHDTTLTWRGTPGVSYVVYWRPTRSAEWSACREVGAIEKATIEKVNKDDHEFAVAAVGGLPVAAR
jgi:hypothetical protein